MEGKSIKRPPNFKSLEAELDIAFYNLDNGFLETARKHFMEATKMVAYDHNLVRMGTLEVAKEKYIQDWNND